MTAALPWPAGVILDLDGTLVDTLPDIAAAAQWACVQLSLPVPSVAQIGLWVGEGVELLVKRFLTGEMAGQPPPALLQQGLALFGQRYAIQVCVASQVFPGVMAGLDWLAHHGIPLAVVTNKSEVFTLALLRKLALESRFPIILSGDSLPKRKPDPAPLHEAVRRLGLAATAPVLVVGDSRSDIRAARAAGMPVVAMAYGYNHGRDIREENPDAVLERLDALPALLPPPPPRTRA